MNQARSVTVIPATARFNSVSNLPARMRVAAYARVSTGSEEQQTSYEAQVDYYTRHIQANPECDFVEIYTDEGISGTSTKHRDGFKRMMHDALEGHMDLILTKSVSRFARNTVDTLTAIRKLKEKGVESYFEKENIYTLDSKGELLLTIFSSLAQEESRSISENITWGQRKRFADGKVSLPYKNFLGYEKGEDGFPKVVEEQAKLVRRIYALFLEGETTSSIARIFTAEHIPTPAGKAKWTFSVVESILTNEKYRGDARLQKRVTTDFLTKTMKVNEGEAPQYYVEIHTNPWCRARSLNWYRRNSVAERRSVRTFITAAAFAAKLCVEIAVVHMAGKYGIPMINIDGWFGNVTINSIRRKNVPCRIYTKIL